MASWMHAFFLCVHFPAGWPVHGDAVHLLLPYQALNSRLLGLIWKALCPKEPQRCCFSCIKDELLIVKTFIVQLVSVCLSGAWILPAVISYASLTRSTLLSLHGIH